jgi:hypothetical protein
VLILTDKEFLEICFAANDEKEIDAVLQFIKGNDLGGAFSWELIPSLIALIGSPNESISNTAYYILKVAALEPGIKKDACRKWWEENKNSFNVESKAWPIFTNKKLPFKLRETALHQLISILYLKGSKIQDNYLSQNDRLYQELKNIVHNKSESVEMRMKAVAMIFSHIIIKGDKIEHFPSIKKDCIDIILKIVPVENELSNYIATTVPVPLLKNPDIAETLLNYAKNVNTKLAVKIAIIRHLSLPIAPKTIAPASKRKKIAKYALEILYNLQREEKNEKTKGQIESIAWSLSYVTYKYEALNTGKCETDIGFWQKTVSDMPDDPPEEEPKG